MTHMHLRTCGIILGWLVWGPHSAAAQKATAADSDLTGIAGHWTASGVTLQSGAAAHPSSMELSDAAHPFTVVIKQVGDQLQVTFPAELKLESGREYLLARAGPGVFRHVDDVGRIVELTLTGPDRASLLITKSGGDGRVTCQLERAP